MMPGYNENDDHNAFEQEFIEKIVPKMTACVVNTFTCEELIHLVITNCSPIGKRVLAKTPLLMSEYQKTLQYIIVPERFDQEIHPIDGMNRENENGAQPQHFGGYFGDVDDVHLH